MSDTTTTTTTTTTTPETPAAAAAAAAAPATPAVEDTTLTNPQVVEKYKFAAEAANAALELAASMIQDGAKVVDVCVAADALIVSRTAAVFSKQKQMQKGIAFPTCVSINNVVGHFSPLSTDTTTFKAGDVVKIDLGVHVDGYIALAAHTVVVPSMTPVSGRTADVLLAVHHAAEAVQRMLKPGVTNTEITSVVSKIAEAYHVQPVLGVLSHYMQRYVLDGAKVIANRTDADHKVEEFVVEPNQVFAIDLVFSTGEGKPKEVDQGFTTVYKRNPSGKYSLKLQASRAFYAQVQSKAPTFPFNLRSFEDTKAKFGAKECRQHDLVHPYPVLFEKDGMIVAQAKFTVLVQANKTVKVAGRPAIAPVLQLESQYKIEDEEVLKVLAGAGAGSSSSSSSNGDGSSSAKKKKRSKKKKSGAAAGGGAAGGGAAAAGGAEEDGDEEADAEA